MARRNETAVATTDAASVRTRLAEFSQVVDAAGNLETIRHRMREAEQRIERINETMQSSDGGMGDLAERLAAGEAIDPTDIKGGRQELARLLDELAVLRLAETKAARLLADARRDAITEITLNVRPHHRELVARIAETAQALAGAIRDELEFRDEIRDELGGWYFGDGFNLHGMTYEQSARWLDEQSHRLAKYAEETAHAQHDQSEVHRRWTVAKWQPWCKARA